MGKQTQTTTTPMADDRVLAAGCIYYKWEHYRDSVKRFFLIDKEKGQQEYNERMALIQKIIKGYAEFHKMEHLQAVIELSGQEEGMSALQFLAAGFELCSGSDFTACG
jgi:hypothetical protein